MWRFGLETFQFLLGGFAMRKRSIAPRLKWNLKVTFWNGGKKLFGAKCDVLAQKLFNFFWVVRTAQKVNCSTFQIKPQGSHSEMEERSCLKMLKPKVAWIISKKISWDGIKQTIEIYEQGIVAIVCSTTKGLYTFHVKLCNSGYFLLDFLQQSTFSFLAFGFDVAIWGISEKKINKSYQ